MRLPYSLEITMFGKKNDAPDPAQRVIPHTQLITGVHPAHTTWRLLRWLLFLAALLSIVCGGFLLSVRSAEVRCQYQSLNIDTEKIKEIAQEHGRKTASDFADAFRRYWFLLVILFAAVFTFFELFIHSRWKIYVIYALMAIVAWVLVLYALNLLALPEELTKAGTGG
jgi:hypothetical protein